MITHNIIIVIPKHAMDKFVLHNIIIVIPRRSIDAFYNIHVKLHEAHLLAETSKSEHLEEKMDGNIWTARMAAMKS